MKRSLYLKKISLEEAKEISSSLANLIKLERETIPTIQALDRVTAEPTFAKVSSPPYPCAAMDGIAVKAETTYGATEESPKILNIGKEAFFVNTGNPLPPGMDAVIMIEDIYQIDSQRIEIRGGAYPWQHVRPIGEDILLSEMILPENHKITPYDIGVLLASGHLEIKVKKKPKVFILPTGSELIDPYIPTSKLLGFIETNSYLLMGRIIQDGGEPIRHPLVEDKFEKIREALFSVQEDIDLFLILAGSSAGSEDYTRSIIEESGEVLAHGVAMMPGKPTLLGKFKNRPVIGIPGYPVSAIIAYEELVSPLLHQALGLLKPSRLTIKARPIKKIPSKLGVEEFLRVKVGQVGKNLYLTPLPRGAGILTSFSRADGLVRIPTLSEGLNENEEVDVELLKPLEEVINTVVMVGSHDLTLDLLTNLLRKYYPPVFFSSHPVGSLGGIFALQEGRCHIAGMHLLDPDSGEYNFPYIQRYLKGIEVKVINLVFRQQGLIIQRGNPKGVKGLEDLKRKNLIFINRQKGSGTRILLDHALKSLLIEPSQVQGYEREEYTHMGVASMVASGIADVGLGILSVAKALNLEFVPVVKERYDLIIPSAFFKEKRIQRVIETIRSKEFKQLALNMGGYDISMTGEELTP
ncbi:MAG: molybdopterin biosynthesis protein [Thermodesulfobacteriota bacterium]